VSSTQHDSTTNEIAAVVGELADAGSPRGTELPEVDTQPPTSRSERWLEKRTERKGLRPRDAAYGQRSSGRIVPDQTAGKIIAAFLMVGGLSLISVVTTGTDDSA
jgi:hypothetical protein